MCLCARAGVLREVSTHFIVDARSLTKTGGNHVTVRIISPSGSSTDAYITDKGDGTYRVEYTAFQDGTLTRTPGVIYLTQTEGQSYSEDTCICHTYITAQ